MQTWPKQTDAPSFSTQFFPLFCACFSERVPHHHPLPSQQSGLWTFLSSLLKKAGRKGTVSCIVVFQSQHALLILWEQGQGGGTGWNRSKGFLCLGHLLLAHLATSLKQTGWIHAGRCGAILFGSYSCTDRRCISAAPPAPTPTQAMLVYYHIYFQPWSRRKKTVVLSAAVSIQGRKHGLRSLDMWQPRRRKWRDVKCGAPFVSLLSPPVCHSKGLLHQTFWMAQSW